MPHEIVQSPASASTAPFTALAMSVPTPVSSALPTSVSARIIRQQPGKPPQMVINVSTEAAARGWRRAAHRLVVRLNRRSMLPAGEGAAHVKQPGRQRDRHGADNLHQRANDRRHGYRPGGMRRREAINAPPPASLDRHPESYPWDDNA
jgi:hypothetical protein